MYASCAVVPRSTARFRHFRWACRIGRGEVGAHADPVNSAEMYVLLSPEEEWESASTQEELAGGLSHLGCRAAPVEQSVCWQMPWLSAVVRLPQTDLTSCTH